MSDTCGLTSCAPFARWDLDSQSWKTSEATCLWALTLSSLTLPAWGGLHDGELCEHPTPELHTSGPDFSSLPTPSANDTTGAEDQAQRNRRGAGGSMLRDLPTLLPTPAVNDMGRGKTPEDWDAWTAKMQAAHGNGNGHGKSLEIEAQRLLPTPATANSKSTRAMTASTENGRRSGGGQSSPPGLEEMASILSGHWPDHMPPVDQLPPATVALLPTPNCMDAIGTRSDEALARAKKNGGCANLKDVIPRIGETTVPRSADGSASSDDKPHHQLSLDSLALPA